MTSVPLVLVRLKLRLLRNGLRRGGPALLGFVLGGFGAVIGGGIGYVLAVTAGGEDGVAHIVAPPIGFAALWIGWTLLPLATFGADETLDPARLALLPLRPRPLVTGLALASLAGPAPAAVLCTGLGVLVGYGGGAGFVLVAFAVALGIALAVLTSRLVSTSLAAALTSRRGRDVAVVVVSVAVVGLQGLRFLPGRLTVSDAAWARIADAAAWTPPGLLGRAVVDAEQGNLSIAVLELLPAAVAVVLVGALWARALQRALTMPEARRSRRRASTTAGLRLLHRRGWVPASPVGAVVARELIAGRRDPRRRAGLLNTTLLALGGTVVLVVRSPDLEASVVLATSATAGLAVLTSFNQFGFDGAGMWMDVAAPDSPRALLTGKNLAVCAQMLPIVLVGGLVVAARTGGWAYLPATMLLTIAGLGAGLAVSNIISVVAPTALAERGNPLARGNTGQGCLAGLATMVGFFVEGVLLAPIAIGVLAALNAGADAVTVVAVAGIVYAAGVWFGGRAWATSLLRRRQPEVLALVDSRRVS